MIGWDCGHCGKQNGCVNDRCYNCGVATFKERPPQEDRWGQPVKPDRPVNWGDGPAPNAKLTEEVIKKQVWNMIDELWKRGSGARWAIEGDRIIVVLRDMGDNIKVLDCKIERQSQIVNPAGSDD